MFGRSFNLFKLAGFQIRLDLSWIVIVVFLTVMLGVFFASRVEGYSGVTYAFMGLTAVLGLFGSIVLHELGHAVVARRHGLPMRGITLFIFGGVAEMGGEPQSPKSEFLIAIAGPIVSLILAGAFGTVSQLTQWLGTAQAATAVIHHLAIINLAVVVFNMIPAFPLDGGRVLRSLLWAYKHNLRWATRLATGIGTGFGTLLIALGLLGLIATGDPFTLWWCLLGLFLRQAAQMSYWQLLFREALEGEPVRRFMSTDPITVGPDTTVDQLIDQYIYVHHHKMYPVVDNGHLLGQVTLDAVKKDSPHERSTRKVAEILTPPSEKNTIEAGADATKAFSTLNEGQAGHLMVTENGKLVGILSTKDLQKPLSLRLELQE